jgi:hypothetical protein
MQTKQKAWKWWVGVGLMALSFTLVALSAQAQGTKPVAEIIAMVGTVEIKSPQDAQFRAAKVQDKLNERDQVRTLADSRAKLWCQDETILMLGEKTTLDLAKYQFDAQGRRQNALLKVMEGTLRFIVHKFYAGLPPGFQVEGKTAIMGIRGTDCVIEVHSPDLFINLGGTPVTVTDTATGQSITVPANTWARTVPGQPMATGGVTPAMRQQYTSQTRVGQTQVPGTVGTPPPPLAPGERVLVLGNPLVPSTNDARSDVNPSTNNQNQVSLSVTHQSALPGR